MLRRCRWPASETLNKTGSHTCTVTVSQNLYLLGRNGNWLYRAIFPIVGLASTIIVRAHVEREFLFMSKLQFLTAVFILVTVSAISGQRNAIADEKDNP